MKKLLYILLGILIAFVLFVVVSVALLQAG